MERKRYGCLVLDMDGTLLDSKAMVTESLSLLAQEYGIVLTPENYKAGLGCTADVLMADLGIADPGRAAARWREIMEGMLDRVGLFAGVDRLLAAPVRRGVVTSQTREELTANLTRLHLADRFEFTVTVDDTPHCKPHPRPLLFCLEQMGAAAKDALFVGDSRYDYECALAAGVDFGLAGWGADQADDFSRAKHLFREPGEILALFE